MGARMLISGPEAVKVVKRGFRLVVPVLDKTRLVIVTGKGGVGKSCISAAIAQASARRGLRTLACEVNAKERIAPLLGKPECGPEITSLEENLWGVDVRPQQAMREYALMILKFETIYNAVFENRLVRYFMRFVPSLQELVMLGKILFHLREVRQDGTWRFDRIVIDAPATGHAITFFSVPQVILDTVPPGSLADDAKWMRDLLTDPRTTAPVLVSLPEEMPVNETFDLADALAERVHMKPAAAVLNGFIEPRFEEAELASLKGLPRLAETARAHEVRARLAVRERARLVELGVPLFTTPRLYREAFGRAAVEELAQHLEKGGLL
jgi:anion-transporting  ArsA/GET3 family ATPase